MGSARGGRSCGQSGQFRPGDDGRVRCRGCTRGRRRRQLPGHAGGRMKGIDRLIAATLPVVPRGIVRRIAGRYIAGESLEDAIAVVRALNRDGAMATIDVLGEFIRPPDEAQDTATEYEHALDAIAAEQLDAGISVKLSALGIELDRDLTDETLARVLQTAERHGAFVRI